jgi:hypothetical protein
LTPLSNEDFARAVIALAAPSVPFQPTAQYDPDGDCIEVIARPDGFRARQVDKHLTVYVSRKDGEVIGAHATDIQRLAARR